MATRAAFSAVQILNDHLPQIIIAVYLWYLPINTDTVTLFMQNDYTMYRFLF